MGAKSIVWTAEKYAFHLAAFLLLMVLAAGLLLFGALYTPDSGFELKAGVLDLSGYRRPDDRAIYLNGEWEYYPGLLIASEPAEEQPAPVMTRLPVRGLSEFYAPEQGKGSYRIVLTNVPEEAVLALTIPAYYGEYRVYLDGRLQTTPVAADSSMYFPFTFIADYSGSTHELIIEIVQPWFFGFDKCPVLSDNDLPFNHYAGIRLIFLIFVGMLLFAYVILPVLYRLHSDSYLNCFALTGCLAFVLFLTEILWYSGVFGYLELWAGATAFYVLRLVLKLGLAFTVFILTAYQCKPPVDPRWKRWCTAAAAVLWAAALLALIFLPRGTAVTVCCLCFGVMAIAAMGIQSRGVWYSGRSALLPGVGNLSMLTGFLFSELSVGTGAEPLQQMVLPLCLLISLVCWSLMISDRQKIQIAALKKALTAEQAEARTQAAFLASQIQPHFLYNTLTTIQELCYTDPPQAADTVVRFSNYLRKNIDFMEYKEKIPFSVEMEHIENYMDIQRIRFGDAIRFVKHVEFDRFVLPPLTVQPLIENAVSHGIRRHNVAGTVSLTVRKLGHDIVIAVTDDGEGFDVNAVHSRSLENIRCRIEGAMRGVVRIDSSPGKGTTVTLQFSYKEAMPDADRDRG